MRLNTEQNEQGGFLGIFFTIKIYIHVLVYFDNLLRKEIRILKNYSSSFHILNDTIKYESSDD